MKNKMILIIIIVVAVILFSVIIKKMDHMFTRDSIPPLGDSSDTAILNYKSVNPSFSFDYPNLEGYEITTGSNYIEYGVKPSESAGPTSARVGWKQIVIKGGDDGYWDNKKINKKGIRYSLSEDESTLVFKLSDQGVFINFDVDLPGGYNRKKKITDTIIDSFIGVVN